MLLVPRPSLRSLTRWPRAGGFASWLHGCCCAGLCAYCDGASPASVEWTFSGVILPTACTIAGSFWYRYEWSGTPPDPNQTVSQTFNSLNPCTYIKTVGSAPPPGPNWYAVYSNSGCTSIEGRLDPEVLSATLQKTDATTWRISMGWGGGGTHSGYVFDGEVTVPSGDCTATTTLVVANQFVQADLNFQTGASGISGYGGSCTITLTP